MWYQFKYNYKFEYFVSILVKFQSLKDEQIVNNEL